MPDQDRISKSTMLVTSLGRTGTKFFHLLFKELFPNDTVLHEPDVINFFQYQGMFLRIKKLLEQGKESGFFYLYIRKPLGTWSLIDVSDRRFRGLVDSDCAVTRILNMRKNFISTSRGDLYFEANIAYYGILDLLDRILENYRAVYIVRDGRDWVRSHLNWGQMYGKGYLQGLFAHRWPTAVDVGEASRMEWNDWSKFEKLCWAWGSLNQFALERARDNSKVMILRFEDIFISPGRYQILEKAIDHLSSVCGGERSIVSITEEVLDRKEHAGSGSFPAWSDWNQRQREIFSRHCGELSKKLGYLID